MKYNLKLNGKDILIGTMCEVEYAISQVFRKFPEEQISIEVLPIIDCIDTNYFQIESLSKNFKSEKLKNCNQAEMLFNSWVSSVDYYIEDLNSAEVIILKKITVNNGIIVNTEELKKAIINAFTE